MRRRRVLGSSRALVWAVASAVLLALLPVVSEAAVTPTSAPRVVSRTASSITTDNGDGTETVKIHSAPINYQDNAGQWQSRDDSLVPDAGGGFRRAAGPASIRFAAAADGQVLRASDDDWMIALTLADAATGRRGTVAKNGIEYRDVADGADLKYTVQGDRIKEELVLRRPPAAGVEGIAAGHSRFRLDLAGLTPATSEDGNITFADAAGTVVAKIPPGVAYDRAGLRDAQAKRIPDRHTGKTSVTTKLVRLADGSWAIDAYVDRAWLLSDRRMYPVTIDPTLLRGRDTAATDAYLYIEDRELGDGYSSVNDSANTNYAYASSGEYFDETEYCWHWVTYTAYTFADFDMGMLAGRQISSAILGINVTSGSAPLTVAASSADGYSSATHADGRQTAFVSVDFGYGTGWNYFDARTWVTNWANGSWANYGLFFNSDDPSGVGIAAQESGAGPYIEVTYEAAPGPGT